MIYWPAKKLELPWEEKPLTWRELRGMIFVFSVMLLWILTILYREFCPANSNNPDANAADYEEKYGR